MQKIEEIHLNRILDHYFFSGVKNNFTLRYWLSTQLIRHYFGEEWSSKIIKPNEELTRKNTKGRIFFKTNKEYNADDIHGQYRIVGLAENMLNLQNVEGINGKVEKIKQGEIESTIAEIEIAGHFVRSNIVIKFVENTGSKGHDYDMYISNDEIKLSCEVKCKTEKTEFTKNTVINTLKDARKQLPKGKQSIIYMKIPEFWTLNTENEKIFESAIFDFFKNTSRVVGLIVRWEINVIEKYGQVGFRRYINERSGFLDDKIIKLINGISEIHNYRNWLKIDLIVHQFLIDKMFSIEAREFLSLHLTRYLDELKNITSATDNFTNKIDFLIIILKKLLLDGVLDVAWSVNGFTGKADFNCANLEKMLVSCNGDRSGIYLNYFAETQNLLNCNDMKRLISRIKTP